MIARYFPKLPRSTEELIFWYERYISPIALVTGFIADNLILLRRVDLPQTNALLGFYLLLSGGGILLMNAIESGKLRTPWALKIVPYIPIAVQFAFGGLFSGYLSLYSRSAGISETWIFVVVLAFLLIGNERFMRFYRRFPFQSGLYFVVLFLFTIFFVPVILHSIGDSVFMVSGIVALLGITLFLLAQWFVARESLQKEHLKVAWTIAGLFVLINALYFFNLIPPLPLALKDAGVYHQISRSNDGTYLLQAEQQPWYSDIPFITEKFQQKDSDPIFVFSAVFAPTGLSTPIFHEWQLFDATTSAWITKSRINFLINGGRDGGYRGYSEKFGAVPGDWRVNVLTGSGRVIGRVNFSVVSATATPALVTTTQ